MVSNEDNPHDDTQFDSERSINPEERYFGRPERCFLGSSFHTSNHDLYDRLAKLQRRILHHSEAKRLKWESVIGALSKFFGVPILDQAVSLLLKRKKKLPPKPDLAIHLLAVVDCILRSRYLLITHETLADINHSLGLRITKKALNKVRFRISKDLPLMRPQDPHKCTNHLLRRVAIRVLEHYPLKPADKRWAIQEIIRLAQHLLDDQYYPGCPEVYGYALALLVVNHLHQLHHLPRCRIPSTDPYFRKQVSMAMLRLKKVLQS
ncbi:MAG: hypothetical protein ACFE9R_08965 [Candidatus Hermodarchaeota archaeon]